LRHKGGRVEATSLTMKSGDTDPSLAFDVILKVLRITLVLLVIASILFPVPAFMISTGIANLLVGTSNGDEPVMLAPIFCIIPVLFVLVISSLRKSPEDYNKWKTRKYNDFESASAKLEEIFTSKLQGEDLDRAISSIPKRLEKFEGKWDELIVWAEEKHGPQ